MIFKSSYSVELHRIVMCIVVMVLMTILAQAVRACAFGTWIDGAARPAAPEIQKLTTTAIDHLPRLLNIISDNEGIEDPDPKVTLYSYFEDV